MSTSGIARGTCWRPCATVDVGRRPFAEPPAESEPTANQWAKSARNDALHPRVRDHPATRGRNVSGTTRFAHGFARGRSVGHALAGLQERLEVTEDPRVASTTAAVLGRTGRERGGERRA